MNRETYMKQLRKQLRKLPREEFDKAVAYFEEYFDEAGEENERQAVEDLGSPQEAAGQIIRDIAIRNTREPADGVKKEMNAVWVGILALFAAPIALPVLFAGVVCLLSLIFCIFVVVLCAYVTAGAVLLTGPVAIVGGISVMAHDIAVGISCLGFGMIGSGLGLLVGYGTYRLCRKITQELIRFFGKMAEKGAKRNE